MNKTAVDKLDKVISGLKDITEKAIYLNDITMDEATEKKRTGVNIGDLPFMILYDYLSKYDNYISVLEEIRENIKAGSQNTED